MIPNQNTIHRSEFNFKYQSKVSASRCNILIESIFESHILPELEKAISNKIPDGVQIELSKLEIDIGNIDAKELSAYLPKRIRESLEKALFPLLNARTGLPLDNNTNVAPRDSKKYFLSALELFLTRGYFPLTLEGSATIDDWIVDAIRENDKETLGLFKKYRGYDSVIKRITYSLKPKTIDRVMQSLDPVNNVWINDFRQIMIYAKREQGLNHVSDAEFTQMINYLSLSYLLNETSQAFNRRRFASSILNDLLATYNLELPLLSKSINHSTGNKDVLFILNDTLLQLPKAKSVKQKTIREQDSGSLEKHKSKSENKVDVAQNIESISQRPADDLVDAIELLLDNKKDTAKNGKAHSIEALLSDVLAKNKTGLLELLYKHRRDSSSIKNLVKDLKTSSFDLILSSIVPVESKWILDFRKIFLARLKESNSNSFGGAEIDQSLNSFILIYLLNQRGPAFNRRDFITFVLREMINAHGVAGRSISFEKIAYIGSDEIPQLIAETLDILQPERDTTLAKKTPVRLDIDQIIQRLNAADFKSIDRRFLKTQIIEAIAIKSKRDQLVDQLNEQGSKLILELFESRKGTELFELIKSFSSEVTWRMAKTTTSNLKLTTRQAIIKTILFLNESRIRSFDQEELVLFLIYSSGVEGSKIKSSESLKHFVQKQKNLDFKRIRSFIDDEQEYPEISAISKSLLENQLANQEGADIRTPKESSPEEYSMIYSRKIVGYFLGTGQLPGSYLELAQQDVQVLFMDLIRQRDNFLVFPLMNSDDSENLVRRIYQLIDNDEISELEDYFSHFFPDEFALLSKLIGEVRQQLEYNASARLSEKKFILKLLIEALAAGDGGNSSGDFMHAVFERLKQEVAVADSKSLLQFLISKSRKGTDSTLEQKFYQDFKVGYDERFKKTFEKDFNELDDMLVAIHFEDRSRDPKIRQLIQRIAKNFLLSSNTLAAFISDQRTDLFQIYTLFKFHLPESQWTPIKKAFIAQTSFRTEIERVERQTDA
ncbi:MAG TPA: contractile injection system tape measure protein, partial [Sunxiuqinia sp.]|nr:contractile injection system tape measure protein [Sunxiuqinia sp.]